jgi:RNA polymerase sigma-70 factor (ECF subfamily)
MYPRADSVTDALNELQTYGRIFETKNCQGRLKDMTEPQPKDFEKIFTDYGRDLYLFLLRLTGNVHDAQDLTQESFFLAFRSLDSFKGQSSLKTWLYSIAINKFRDNLRKNRRFIPGGEAGSADIPSARLNPLESLERQEQARRVHAALQSLPENFRTALILVRFEEMTYKEAGIALGTTVETVRMRVHRAHLMLADFLKK